MKVWQKCKGENVDNGVFCTFCGSKLELASPPLLEPADNTPREVLRFLVQKHPECVKSLSLLKDLLADSLAKAERFFALCCR